MFGILLRVWLNLFTQFYNIEIFRDKFQVINP